MPEPITPLQLQILAFVGRNPDVTREQLAQAVKASPADLAYLELHDLIREREVGHFRIAHFGQKVLQRGGR